MSMTTSLWNRWRYSYASRATRTQASGSSPFTWKIGACTILATSVAYWDERDCSGAVVKPIWLLTTRWMVPPTRYPVRSLMASPSATMPWPANAASPCISTGSTLYTPGGWILSCLARTMPRTTPFTVSRWLGFAASSTSMVAPAAETYDPCAPRWYFTSPLPCTESELMWPSNSLKIWL